ncbi:hypothetical protein HYH03_006121 [Edaphochlamys debaryana]|uniref:Uncharacterized protein n=1 Tax=Edaphochlamys debaryana TaxID=47281 RepID=A0A836C1R6_9CHLO|nr:hypothetical protein HYH03_006121 [Edaphochlamys debaryana]|eukprot:KAG2495883.1 hypothetical protein HYH03_006121 [Edaphochlamys debaryana]
MSAALLRQRSGSRLGIGPVHGDDGQDQKAEEAALLVSHALESAQLGVKRPPPGRGASSSLPQLPFGGPSALAAQPPLRSDTGTPTTAHVSSPHDTGTTMGTMGGLGALCLSAPNGPTAPWDEEDDPAYVSPLRPPKPSAVPPRKLAAPTAAGSPAGVGLPYNPADLLPSRSGSEASVDRMSVHSCFIRRYGSGTSTASDFAMAALEAARASSGPIPVGDALLRKIEGALCTGSMRPEEAQDLLMKSFGCDLEELIRTELGPDAIPPLPAGAHRRSAGGTASSDAISAEAFGGVEGSK